MHVATEEAERLVEEIQTYLRAVETFRREGCEPRWRQEWPPDSARAGRVPAGGER